MNLVRVMTLEVFDNPNEKPNIKHREEEPQIGVDAPGKDNDPRDLQRPKRKTKQ